MKFIKQILWTILGGSLIVLAARIKTSYAFLNFILFVGLWIIGVALLISLGKKLKEDEQMDVKL